MDVPQGPVIQTGGGQVVHATGGVIVVVGVAAHVAVQHPDGKGGIGVAPETGGQIGLDFPDRITDAVDVGQSGAVPFDGKALHVLAPEAPGLGGHGEVGLPAGERVVIAVGDETGDARLAGLTEGIPEAELSPQAAVLAVVHVPGDDDKICRLAPGQVNDLVEGLEGRLPEHRGNFGGRGVDALKRAVQVQIGAMQETKGDQFRHAYFPCGINVKSSLYRGGPGVL